MSELKVQGLTKIFGDHPQRAMEALEQGMPKSEVHEKTGQVVGAHDVSFEVGHGELFVVMGLSGSGKSTVVRMINRLFEPTGAPGRVRALVAELRAGVEQPESFEPPRG